MLAAVMAVVFGAGMFGASFIMFVTVLEDIRLNKVPQGMVSAVYVLAAMWFVTALLGLITIAVGFATGFNIIAHVV